MNMTPAHDSAENLDAEIGARVHQAMFRARVSQTRMAPLIGVNQSVLSRKLRGVVAWSAVDVIRAAHALDIPLTELLPPTELFVKRALASNDGSAQFRCTVPASPHRRARIVPRRLVAAIAQMPLSDTA